jgi:hypothetical protein
MQCSKIAFYSITSSASPSSCSDVQAGRLGCLDVEHQIVLGRLHDRQVGPFFAFDNTTDTLSWPV